MQPLGERCRAARRRERRLHGLRHEFAAAPEELEVPHDDLQVIVEIVGERRGDLLKAVRHPAHPTGSGSPSRSKICKRLPGMSGPKIGITGSYGGLNLGDEAILQSILAQLREEVPDAEVTVFSRDADDTKRRHKVERAVPVRKLSRSEVVPEVERLDRKSTRLNSSHPSISYAVFCLKK